MNHHPRVTTRPGIAGDYYNESGITDYERQYIKGCKYFYNIVLSYRYEFPRF